MHFRDWLEIDMLKLILGLIFPPKCIFCSKILDVNADIYICSKCFKYIPFATKGTAALKRESDLYDDIICVCEYMGMVKEALRRFKFSNKPSYGRTFARLLANKINNMTSRPKFDIIISVPLHYLKEQTRGYNQAYLISKELSRKFGVPEKSRILTRTRNTDSQSLLAKNQRIVNIKDAFKVNDPTGIKGKTILLIDDILTTGSTLNECSGELKRAGAKYVVAAVIASGRKF